MESNDLSSLILCQKNIQELFTLNQRLEKKLEIQEQKLSQVSLSVSQRNEDILLRIESYTPLKQFREENTYLRNYLDTKTRTFLTQVEQVQIQLTRQMQLIKEENQQQYQMNTEKITRMTKEVLFQLESMEKKIQSNTTFQIEELTKKSAEMEQNFMKLFSQKHKLMEKLALSQETQLAKINVFENTLNQQLSTNHKNQTPFQSGRKLNFESTHDVPIEILKRQEDALNYMSASIRNIEKKLQQTDQKPNLKRELSFDQYSVQWSQPKVQIQERNNSQPLVKPIQLQQTFQQQDDNTQQQKKNIPSEIIEKSSRSELASNAAEILQHELKSPNQKTNQEISKEPLLNKISPKPLIASPSQNIYEDVRIEKEYQQKMQSLKDQEEIFKQSRLKQQQEYDKQLNNLRKSQSQISNESSIKNDSYFIQSQVSQSKNDQIQEIKKSSGGLRSLMERSKEREVQNKSQQVTKQNLNKSNSFKNSPYQQSPTKNSLAPVQQTGKFGGSGGRKSRTNQMRTLAQQQRQQQDQSADEIVYQLDEDGYLMDENGNYLLDEKGNYIQISDKDLEELKKQNLVVEQD